MSITQDEIVRLGFRLPAASEGEWREYDEANPIPGYFQFDWLSSRHPDLYHTFALSTVLLMDKLHTLVDLSGCQVIDIGAGTGRSALAAARKAKRVYALDAYQSVVRFGRRMALEAQIGNLQYINGDRSHLPFQDSSLDVALNTWAELDLQEAYRVLKPGGWLIQLGAPLSALCGELTALLAPDYPWIPAQVEPQEVYQPGYPEAHFTVDNAIWGGTPVLGAIQVHQFTAAADYGSYQEAAAIAGRLYGPKAKHYFLSREQSTFAWRLQVILGQVSKPAV